MAMAPEQRESYRRMGLARASRALWFTAAGTALDTATVIVCAADVVSDTQAIAMALPAGLITAGGFVACVIPDPWHAWRRGFRHGWEASAVHREDMQ
jgi:hypothetical protein